jgi:hypothetical protein
VLIVLFTRTMCIKQQKLEDVVPKEISFRGRWFGVDSATDQIKDIVIG